MFAKAEWFKQSACCQGVSPGNLKGWLYLAGAGAFVVLPMVALGLAGKIMPEAPIWLAFSSLAYLWDMRGVRRQLQAEHDRNLLYISDEKEPAELATRNFDMKLRG